MNRMDFSRRGFVGGVGSLLIWGRSMAGAQEAASGRLLFVNAVGGAGKAFFELDGDDVNPSGFEAGRTAGWFDYPAKEYTVSADHDPSGSISQKVMIAAGSRQALILHSVRVPSRKQGRPPVMSVAWHVFNCAELWERKIPFPKNKKLIIVHSFCAKRLSLKIGASKASVEQGLKFATVISDDQRFLPLTLEAPFGEARAEMPEGVPLVTLNMEDRHHVAVILFDDERHPDRPGLAAFDLD